MFALLLCFSALDAIRSHLITMLFVVVEEDVVAMLEIMLDFAIAF